jgi:peptidyl-prolyl cis-trans isomerase A (cyclophilin A)
MKTLILLGLLLTQSTFAADKAAEKKAMPSKNPVAVIKTSMGSITVTLFKDKAPITVENFTGLSNGSKEWTDPKSGKKMKGKSLYVGTIFHRVIPGFMIQGGDPLGQGIGGPGYQFQDEVSPLDSFAKPGILAMANAGPNTNGSQFFITLAPTPHLNGHHTIFGEVTEGMDVVSKIGNVARNEMDRPNQDVKIISIKIKN